MSSAKRNRWCIFFYGFLFWNFWTLIYSIALFIGSDIPTFFIAFMTSIQTNYLFALLSIFIWYTCKRIHFEKFNILILFLIHFLIALFLVTFWILVIYGSWYLIFGKAFFHHFNVQMTLGWQFTFGLLNYFLVAGIYYTMIYYQNFREKELAETNLKLLTRDAELKALKLQLNPHFLFNSLNSVNALITENASLARKMIAKLAEFFRMTLDLHDHQFISLQDELWYAEAYREIEEIRFGDKMQYEEEIEATLLTKSVPSMLLQPLLENAIKHGIANRLEGGLIRLVITAVDQNIRIEVTNPINRNSQIVVEKLLTNGTGLSNLKKRLDQLYHKNYKLDIDLSEENLFRICLQIPIEIEL
ncbi:histidine kinase [candidate division KSB1 bacterium]|nr:histidine kinase [candidate division KSB1 bacterium]